MTDAGIQVKIDSIKTEFENRLELKLEPGLTHME
jgi:hypothetical protein